jgi:hypothetical protein
VLVWAFTALGMFFIAVHLYTDIDSKVALLKGPWEGPDAAPRKGSCLLAIVPTPYPPTLPSHKLH